jgi:hypothetical protein
MYKKMYLTALNSYFYQHAPVHNAGLSILSHVINALQYKELLMALHL